jgi:raffinose/stachyose/melibiose transport system permease protein
MNPSARKSMVWLYLAPALVFYLAFVIGPIGQSFAVSFFDWDGIGPMRYVGLDHYARLATDGIFWKSLGRNFVLLALSLVIQLPLACLLAVLLSGRVLFRGLFRTFYFAPMILSTVVIGVVWAQIFLPAESGGLLTRLLGFVGLPVPAGGFLGTSGWLALLSLIIAISWRYIGFYMVLFMAGIEGIPEDLYEAARIDGAGPWSLFRHVTLPSLGRVIRISAVLSIVGSLKYFDLVWVMTRGDGPWPHATDLNTTYMYKTAFMAHEYGYGSAIAVAGFVVSMLVVLAVASLRPRGSAASAEVFS